MGAESCESIWLAAVQKSLRDSVFGYEMAGVCARDSTIWEHGSLSPFSWQGQSAHQEQALLPQGHSSSVVGPQLEPC